MKPLVVCHMMVSLDGRIHPSRWTASPNGNRQDWTKVYEHLHDMLAGRPGDLAGAGRRVRRSPT